MAFDKKKWIAKLGQTLQKGLEKALDDMEVDWDEDRKARTRVASRVVTDGEAPPKIRYNADGTVRSSVKPEKPAKGKPTKKGMKEALDALRAVMLLEAAPFYEIPVSNGGLNWQPVAAAVAKLYLTPEAKSSGVVFIADPGDRVGHFGSQKLADAVLSMVVGGFVEDGVLASEATYASGRVPTPPEIAVMRRAEAASNAIIKVEAVTSPKTKKKGYRLTMSPTLAKIEKA